MKKSILSLAVLFSGALAYAQHDIYALTGKSAQQILFSDLRPMNVDSGTSGPLLLTAESDISVHSQALNSVVKESRQTLHNAQGPAMAALAHSKTGNELIFAPMYSSNIYVLDLNTKKITLVENTAVKTTTCDLGSHITRMTAGYDGNIYALNNAGSQLIKIAKKGSAYTVTDLGPVNDISSNPQQSLRTVQGGFGGDMVADANGDLYIFAASGNVFKLSLQTLTSEFVGKISGLPGNYSLNGAAVSSDGTVVIGSAKMEGFYKVKIDDLTATPFKNEVNYHIYDLASKHFLGEHSKTVPQTTFAGIEVYPTKVTSGELFVRVTDTSITGLVIDLYDSAGIKVISRTVKHSQRAGDHLLNVGKLKQGLYIVTVSSENGEQLYSKKILMQ